VPKILIVDDDPVVQMLYKKHLEREGFDLLIARNGAEALTVVAQTKPDLILMDVMMPVKDGLSALRELKHNEATRDVPVIVMTANVSRYDTSTQEAKLAGAEGFLTKPLSPARLVSEVRRFLPVH
jgi:two-component system, OmpR family, alkaline phosphatase synthesis response regulator PhoP